MTKKPDTHSLGYFDATSLIVGSMIGSGIFFVPVIMARWLQAPGILLGAWLFGGVFTILGALAYAELAAMAPVAGGQYIYLREAYGRFAAFMYGWTLFLVIQTGFIAAVAIAFAKYLGVFIPALGESNVLFTVPTKNWLPATLGIDLSVNSAQLTACAMIVLLTAINIRGLREGKFVQNLFTVLKVAALVVIIAVGLTKIGENADHFQPLFSLSVSNEAAKVGFLAGLAVALSKALFCYDSWYTVTFVTEEVRQPQRTLPRALLTGCLIVTTIYVLTNLSYMAVLSPVEMMNVPEQRVTESVAASLLGNVGVTFVVSAILVSTFGCVNGLILSGSRVLYAMAREGLFFRNCASLHKKSQIPVVALIYQCVWSCLLAVSGSYDMLLTYTVSAAVLFGALTVASIYVLRRTQADRPRPYRCWGYPVTPALYLIIAVSFLVYVTQGDPHSAWKGFILILSGLPFYLIWNRKWRA